MKVYIIESEAGWGQKIDEIKEFNSKDEAIEFVKKYNNKYNPIGVTPNWYMYAKLADDDSYGMMR